MDLYTVIKLRLLVFPVNPVDLRFCENDQKKQLLTIRQSRQTTQNRPDVTVFRDHDMSPVGEDTELLKMTGRTRSPF